MTEVDMLHRIDLITDAALAELDVPDLLEELLVRVRELLAADTAAVLLLDPATRELVATAAKGLEEEVRQGVRIPLERGFAGRVAAERRPIQIEHVDSDTVINPILWRTGIRSMLGVPLVCNGDLIGVMHVGTLVPRRFSDEDVRLLQLVADRAALATQVRRSNLDRAAALALQRSLLPGRLPTLPGLELAARYVPSDHGGVSGDWYDVFLLDGDRLCLVMGDVVGHGLPAAIVMGRLRSALRAYALETDDPAEVITRLDRKIQHFEPGITATALYLVVDPGLHQFRISVAGHPPPVLATPGKPTTVLDIPADLPLGVLLESPRHSSTVPLDPDSLLCLYTDGLIERRHQSLRDGIDGLCAAVAVAPPAEVCAKVMAALVSTRDPDDDVALLALRRGATTP
ncbi:MAG: GAF domain-containing SpoIIE family protein phosphatase [Actinocatenispora sp.]